MGGFSEVPLLQIPAHRLVFALGDSVTPLRLRNNRSSVGRINEESSSHAEAGLHPCKAERDARQKNKNKKNNNNNNKAENSGERRGFSLTKGVQTVKSWRNTTAFI